MAWIMPKGVTIETWEELLERCRVDRPEFLEQPVVIKTPGELIKETADDKDTHAFHDSLVKVLKVLNEQEKVKDAT